MNEEPKPISVNKLSRQKSQKSVTFKAVLILLLTSRLVTRMTPFIAPVMAQSEVEELNIQENQAKVQSEPQIQRSDDGTLYVSPSNFEDEEKRFGFFDLPNIISQDGELIAQLPNSRPRTPDRGLPSGVNVNDLPADVSSEVGEDTLSSTGDEDGDGLTEVYIDTDGDGEIDIVIEEEADGGFEEATDEFEDVIDEIEEEFEEIVEEIEEEEEEVIEEEVVEEEELEEEEFEEEDLALLEEDDEAIKQELIDQGIPEDLVDEIEDPAEVEDAVEEQGVENVIDQIEQGVY